MHKCAVYALHLNLPLDLPQEEHIFDLLLGARCKPFDCNGIFSSRTFLTTSTCRRRTRSCALHASLVGSDKLVFLILLHSSHHCFAVGLSFSHILTRFQHLLNQIVQEVGERLNLAAKLQQIVQIRIDNRILDWFCSQLLRPPTEKFR